MEESEQYHLLEGTEVSAKYRGAFCEARIKSVKKSVIYKVSLKKDGKIYSVSEDEIKGSKKIGSNIEVQLPDLGGWHEGIVHTAKDKSLYTVEFDDGDVRTLSRGSLCLQGVRHFAEGDTLDQLPLTDPENFGTPVLNWKRKPKRKVTQTSVEVEEIDSDDQRSLEYEGTNKKKSTQTTKVESKDDEEDDEESMAEKKEKWLSDPLMGRLVLVEPSDKRKHWYPAVCVNPMSIEEYEELGSGQIVVRSFKKGKFFTVERCERLIKSNTPHKVEQQWKDVLESAFAWEENGTIPESWKTYVGDEDDDESSKKDEDEDDEKRREFLEQLYKFMEDRCSPITKQPVLGYKDLDLYLLYNLVQAKGGFYRVSQPSDWREIYSDLGIPKITQAAGHHAKMAYAKYLLCFEEYLMSFRNRKSVREKVTKSKKGGKGATKCPRQVDDVEMNGRRTSRRRKLSESLSVTDEVENPTLNREVKRVRKNKPVVEVKRESDTEDAGSPPRPDKPVSTEMITKQCASKKESVVEVGSVKKQAIYKVGDKLKVKYGKDLMDLYQAKVIDKKADEECEWLYLVHYAGWNSRYDEWVKPSKILSLLSDSQSCTKPLSRTRPKTPTFPEEKKPIDLEVSPSTTTPPQGSPSASEVQRIPSPIPPPPASKKNEQCKRVKEFQDRSKKMFERTKRVRRRSTSSSTPPPLSPNIPPPVDRNQSNKEEPKQVVKEETNSGDEKQTEKSSPPGVPLGLFPVARRTSGRRSKSPAYLRESALYGLTKRKRNLSAAGEAASGGEVDLPQDIDDLSSESSSKSFNSSTSDASRSSPLTIWKEADKMAEKKAERKRVKRKSGDQKLTQIEEEKTSLLSSATYGDFDDDVPNIELEKTSNNIMDKLTSATQSTTTEPVDASTGQMDGNSGGEETKKEEKIEEKSESSEGKSSSQSSSSEGTSQSDQSSSRSSQPPQNGNPPPSSKTLLDNTPPTTPGGSEHQSSDETDSTLASGDSSSLDDQINSLTSPHHQDDPAPDDDDVPPEPKVAKIDNEEDGGSNEANPPESESDGEATKNKQKRNIKKRNKKKKRPEPPKAPTPLAQQDLDQLNSDERIQTMLDRIEELRKLYQQLKQEVSWIDRKRKRAKRREQEAAEQGSKKNGNGASPSKHNDPNEPLTDEEGS